MLRSRIGSAGEVVVDVLGDEHVHRQGAKRIDLGLFVLSGRQHTYTHAWGTRAWPLEHIGIC
jgi:hypothetical protein